LAEPTNNPKEEEKMRKNVCSCRLELGVSVLVLLLALGTSGFAQNKAVNIRFAGSSMGGSFYIAVGGFAPYASKLIPALSVTPVTTRGSAENCRMIPSKKADMALATSNVVHSAYFGLDIFKGENNKDIRAVAVLGGSGQHWVTFAKSGIKTLYDLKGKTIAIGPVGSASAQMAEQTLDAMGIKGQIEIQKIGYSDAAMALKDGHLDAFAICGRNLAAVIEAATANPIRLLAVPDDILKQLLQNSPGYSAFTIDANTYEGVDYPVKTLGYAPIWIAHKDVPEWAVYEMVKLAYSPQGRKHLDVVQDQWKYAPENDVDLILQMKIPLHPGAQKYWKESGALK